MSTIKTLYPSTSTAALTLGLSAGPLASDTNLLAGRASAAVDNTVFLDLDHLVSGMVTTGTSPTGGQIEVWAYAPYKMAAGTPTYPDSITGSDANKSMTSANVKIAALRLVASISVDTTSSRSYYFGPTSIAALFGAMPPLWGLFVVHNTGVNLNSTAGNHDFEYERVQAQSV